ncbi:MAG: hypothetical protein ACRCS3_08540 [Paracoccaceae bacterium]
MGFGLGNIFRDVILDYGRLQPLLQILSQGPGNFVSDSVYSLLLESNFRIGYSLGLFNSPYSQEQRDQAQPPVDPRAQPVPQILILPDPLPERVTEVMQDWFEFAASNNPTPYYPGEDGWAYQQYDNYTFLV